ncbi:RNA-directed DNA polymerase, eukaryota, reverse transcriptase zinc-binding domain protein [Tanacetum coccineum]
MTNTSKQDEVKLLIREEKVSMCAIIETQVSKKFVNQVGDNVFGNWNWVSNSVDSNRGCRIMVGWDRNIVGANLISQTDQVMHFEVNFSHDHRKQFVSFVYAKNFERDRKPLWRNLSEHNMLVSNDPWVVLGDFNVIMNTDECSNSFNIVDRDMDVFRRVLHSLELEDIVSYEFLKADEVVYDSEGHKYEGDYIAPKFVDHFSKFLGTEDEVFPIEDPDSLFINKLDAQCADYMVRPVLDDEIKFAMFSIEDDKAAGPDGYTSKFFKTAWNIVGGDVCAAVKEFFYSSKLLGEFNANLISLVPKLQTPLKITDYRPIACCNVVYKCISKVITNRLKEGLGSIVDSNQSAFIPGRQISDNIFLAQEFMHGYGRKGGAQRCAFKVDIEKAYDTVNWEFLKIALQRFGFHSSMIKWIMVCLTTASFSICVNGEMHGFFKGKRGLRQGDPMSPYLFTIVMEVLNLMIKRQIRLDSRFRYHWGCSKINLTHLCFADDLLMLCHGDLISASILRRALDEFSMTSGLYPSMAKSTVFYSNVPDDVKEDIHLAMPFREGELPVRYLGIPLTSKMLSIADCRVLVEKVKKRIFDWRNKSLSFAGKLQLVASVLSSLHVYWASMFMLPVSICDSIDKLFKNFIWGKSESSSGIASVSWKDVCRPKNQGGLGLKSLRVMNCALMVKHLWYIASRKESLWVKWLNVYKLKGECLWDMKVRDSFSWNLKQILKLRDSIWPFEWSELFSEVIDVPVPVLSSDSVDKALWFNKKNEEVQFSVKEAWKVLRIDGPEVMWHKHVWFSQCIPRHAFILWMALKGRLKTQDRISRWIGADNMGIWDRLKLMCRLEDLSYVWAEIVSGISVRKANNTLWSIIQRLVFGVAVYFIWQERNFRLFRSVERPADKVFDIIVDTVRLRLLGLKIKRSHEVDKAAAIWKIPNKGVGKRVVMGLSTLWSFSWIGIMDYSMGMTSSFFRSCACDHPVVITISDWVGFGGVGWGGFGFHIWDGVIRECRVEKSNVPVLTHRICRVRWFFLSLRDCQSFLYIVYGLTWVISFVPLGSGGIRGVRLCSDKRRLSRLPLDLTGVMLVSSLISLRLVVCCFGLGLFSWYSLMGVWENTSWVRFWAAYIFGVIRFWCCISFIFRNGSFYHGTSGLGVLGYWGFGFPNYDARLFNFGSVSSYADFGLYFDAGIGFYYDSGLINLSCGHVSGLNTGFWKCNTIYIIDKGSRLEWLKDFSSVLVRIHGSLNVQVLNFKDLWLVTKCGQNLHVNARANALRLVKEIDEATGWERRRAEVDLFMLTKRPLMDDFKEIWTDDMVEYFLERCEEIKNDEKNGHYADDSGFDEMEEVGEDVSGSANFVTQNEVSSDIDGSMAQMQGGLAAHPSNLQ